MQNINDFNRCRQYDRRGNLLKESKQKSESQFVVQPTSETNDR